MATIINKDISWRWLIYNFRGSVHSHHDREHGSVQVDVVLELRALHPTGNGKWEVG